MTEEENDKNFKRSLALIEEWGEKNKPLTLYEILHNELRFSDADTQKIIVAVSKWLPREDPRAWIADPWNKCVKRMKEKLKLEIGLKIFITRIQISKEKSSISKIQKNEEKSSTIHISQ